MRTLLKVVSYAGLALTIIPVIARAMSYLEPGEHKVFMLIGMIIWFLSSPFWINAKASDN